MGNNASPIDSISIVIPAYNEEKIILDNIRQVKAFLITNATNYEIIVVNDGSTDKTAIEIEKAIRTNGGIRIYSYPENKGKGYAVKCGLLEAKYQTVAILDADLSVSPQLIKKALDLFPRADLVYGRRFQVIPQPFYRIIVGKCWQVLVFLTTGIFADTQCPLKICKLDKIFYTNLKTEGFAYDVELILRAKQQKYKVESLKVPYINDEDSSVTLQKTAKMFFELIRIRIGR